MLLSASALYFVGDHYFQLVQLQDLYGGDELEGAGVVSMEVLSKHWDCRHKLLPLDPLTTTTTIASKLADPLPQCQK